MRIQVISYNNKISYTQERDYTYSSFSKPLSLDAFDINIISLQNSELWTNQSSNHDAINAMNDLRSIGRMINASKKTKILICFPQNYTFQYGYDKYLGGYQYYAYIKDILISIRNIIDVFAPCLHGYELVYDNSLTKCLNSEFSAAFMFDKIGPVQIATKSLGSEHVTTYFATDDVVFTTLDLSKPSTKVHDFLCEIGLIKENNEIPEWIQECSFFDDVIQQQIILDADKEIERQQKKIEAANTKINENLHYKSILFENGEPLVKVVFEILERILDINLSDFVDEKKEDFKIVFQDVTFIGEIKGITSNVRSEHVSQLDVHCNSYIDDLDTEEKSENVKGILIINPMRHKPIAERDVIHEKQVQLAQRNGSLIVTTEMLLNVFVGYLDGRLTTETIIGVLKNKTGLLTISDFD